MNFSERLSTRSKVVIIVSFLFILIALPLLVFLASNKESSDNRTQASLSSDAETLTKELIDPNRDEASKLDIATRRKEIMANLAKEDPDLFILNVISPEMKAQLPASTQDLIEGQTEIEGEISENISEDEDPIQEQSHFVLQELDGEGFVKNAYMLYLRDGQSPNLNSKVRVKGYLINNILIPITIEDLLPPVSTVLLASSTPTKSVLGISTSGNKKVGVIMVNFKADKSDTGNQFTREELEKIYFKGENSATNYLNTASGNQINLNGDITDIYGWIHLPNYTRKQVCDVYETGNGKGFIKAATDKARTQASNRGKNFDDYDIIGFVFPYADIDCNWGSAIARGVGNVDSNAKPYHFLNGDYCKHSSNCSTKDLKFYGGLLAHEMGHNLGLSHANGLSCGSKVIDSYGKCKSITYGDRFDISGGDWTYFPQTSASNQIKYLNWIPADNQKNVNPNNIRQDGTYTLYSVSKKRPQGQLQFLRIPRPVEGGAYYIEARSKNGLDNNLPSNLFGGAIIRLSEVPNGKLKNEVGSLQYRPQQTYLINPNRTNPATWSHFLNPALSDGKSFTDPTNGIKITQVSHNKTEGSVTLKVDFLPTACILENPSITIDEPVKAANPGQQIQYSFKLKNNNSSICRPAVYKISAQSPSGWVSSFSNSNVTLNSDQSITLSASITSPAGSNISGNPYKISLTAQNNAKASSTTTKEIRYNILQGTGPAIVTEVKTPTKSPTKPPITTATKTPTTPPTKIPTTNPTSIPPSVSIKPDSTYIKLQFGLQGIGNTGTNTQPNLSSGNKNPFKKNVDVTIKVYGKENTPEEIKGKAFYDSTIGKYVGTFELKKAPGEEVTNIFISTPGYLAHRLDARILPNQVNSTPEFNFSGGDIDENEERNLLDWNLLNACSIFKFNNPQLCPDGSKFKQNSDMNSDGVVDQSDITLFYQELFGSRRY